MKDEVDKILSKKSMILQYFVKIYIENEKTKALAEIVEERDNKKLITQDFDRFDEDFIEQYMGIILVIRVILHMQRIEDLRT